MLPDAFGALQAAPAAPGEFHNPQNPDGHIQNGNVQGEWSRKAFLRKVSGDFRKICLRDFMGIFLLNSAELLKWGDGASGLSLILYLQWIIGEGL